MDVTGLSTLASVDINGGNIDNTVIGATTKAAGSFTSVKVSGDEGILINKDAPNATESVVGATVTVTAVSESSDLTSANHGFVDNTIVLGSGDFVAEVDTLSINTPYYVKKVDVDEFSLHQSSVDVDSGANTIAITNFADTSKNLIVTTAITSLVVAEANGSGAVTINKKAFTVTLDIPELNTDVWVEYKITVLQIVL